MLVSVNEITKSNWRHFITLSSNMKDDVVVSVNGCIACEVGRNVIDKTELDPQNVQLHAGSQPRRYKLMALCL